MNDLKPWLLLEAGVLINLNYVIKVVRIDTVTPTYGICFFHATSGQSGGTASGTQKVTYASAVVADERFAAITTLLSEQETRFADVSA